MPLRKPRRRRRGAATCLCPHRPGSKRSAACGEISKVLRTTRDPASGSIVRHRVCTAGHRFTTEEIPK